MGDGVIERLRAVLPAGAVVEDPVGVAERSVDRSGEPSGGTALAVVRAASTADVSATLRIADELRVPVVPQGALTGVAGAANALPGAILLDLSGMDRIVEVDPVNRLAVVEPGVIVADLAAAAADRGLFYAPDPASALIATVGGTVATNAGGMRCIKYGVTRDAVRSLEVVLPGGAVIDTRAVTRKAVAGLDVTGLVVGSEGTLAVVTRATLALLPAPGPNRGIVGLFPDTGTALAAARDVATGPRLPSTLEMLDAVALEAIRAISPEVVLAEGTGAWLLAVTDVWEGADVDLARFEAAFVEHGAVAVHRAESPAELEALLAARRELHPAMRALRGESTNGDIAVPIGRLADAAARIAAIADELGVTVSVGGHVGDGNLHPIIAFDPTDPAEVALAHATIDRIVAAAQDLGGTATGEHGIGSAKLGALAREMPAELLALQRSIKAAFDPHGILNPGRKY